MQLTLLKGYPDLIGRRQAFAGYGNGPALYVIGGDPLIIPGYEKYIDAVFGGSSTDGTYFVVARPSAIGARQAWRIQWFDVTTGAEAAASTVLSSKQVQIGGFIGEY